MENRTRQRQYALEGCGQVLGSSTTGIGLSKVQHPDKNVFSISQRVHKMFQTSSREMETDVWFQYVSIVSESFPVGFHVVPDLFN